MNSTQVKGLLISEGMGSGLMVKVSTADKMEELVVTDGRFLAKGHAGIIKILDSMKVDANYLLKRQEVFAKEKFTGLKINDRKNPNDVEGMKFPDYMQVIPDNDKDRVKVSITDIVIDTSGMTKRLLIGADGTVLTISNEYWNLFNEVMELNLNDCDITISPGGDHHAITFNFDKKKSLKKSKSIILMMPIRDSISDETIEQLKVMYNTKSSEPIEEPEPVQDWDCKNNCTAKSCKFYDTCEKMVKPVINDTPSMDAPEPVEEVVAVPESDITNGSSDDITVSGPDDITPAAEMISDGDSLKVSKEEAQELFAKVKASKPYKSFDYSSKLIDILINSKVDEVDSLNKDNADSPATYKQTKALYRIIFGKHYSHDTLDALMLSFQENNESRIDISEDPACH